MNIVLRVIRSLLLNVWSFFRFSLNFDLVKKILKIDVTFISQLRKWSFWEKYMQKWSLSLHHSLPQKETKHIHTSAADLLHTVLEKKMSIGGCNSQKEPLEVFCEKKCPLKFCKIYRKHLCRENTCEFWKIFKNTFFAEQCRTTASEIRTLQKRSERNRLFLLLRGGCNAFCVG